MKVPFVLGVAVSVMTAEVGLAQSSQTRAADMSAGFRSGLPLRRGQQRYAAGAVRAADRYRRAR